MDNCAAANHTVVITPLNEEGDLEIRTGEQKGVVPGQTALAAQADAVAREIVKLNPYLMASATNGIVTVWGRDTA